MLSKADIPLDAVLPAFVNREIDVAFLAPTEAHLDKALIDAVGNVRQFLLRNNIHDYAAQKQGLGHRHFVPVKMVLWIRKCRFIVLSQSKAIRGCGFTV